MKRTTSATASLFLSGLFFVISSLFPKSVFCQQAPTFYVATTGSSSNPGTMASPFLRPEDAWNAISKIQGPLNATVYIRGGNYQFSKSFILKQDGTDSTRHISFTNYQNEKVSFTGSRKLDNSKFTLVSDPGVLNRLPAAARGKVYQMDLKAAGITDYGKRLSHGYKTIHPAPLEVFFNETPLTVARYPNEGYLPVETVADPGTTTRFGGKETRGAKFKLSDSRMNNWNKADNAWVSGFFSYGYSDDNVKVDTFDFQAQTIRLKDRTFYGVFSTSDVSNETLKNSQKIRGYYVYNLLEEIDEPGEYFMDEATGLLYLWPPGNSISSADIEVSMLEDPILVLSNTWNVSFKGISFEYSRGMGLSAEGTNHTTITHCSFDDLGTVGISATSRPSRPYNSYFSIESSTICNTGTGAVVLDGGDRKELIPAHNTLDNCEIYNYVRINKTYCPAVFLNGVGNGVTHCFIHDAPTQAIVFYGNDHTIAFNHIKNVVSYSTDAGAVYTAGDIGTTGNVISNNFFDNIASSINSSIAAIYLDDASSGMEIDNNIFYKAGTPGTYHFGAIHINGGSNNTFKNNYFIDCPQAISNTQWPDKQWKNFITNAASTQTYRPGVDIHSATYARKYAYLNKLTDSNSLAPRQNFTFNSLAYNVGVFSAGASLVNKNVYTTTQDPGFADPNKPDFTLTTPPAALQQAGDWKPIPFREIGIKK